MFPCLVRNLYNEDDDDDDENNDTANENEDDDEDSNKLDNYKDSEALSPGCIDQVGVKPFFLGTQLVQCYSAIF